jgi:DNA-binding HxlR family transcriptional regulator
MYIYAKYCPVAAAAAVVGDHWTPLIVRELLYGTEHFNQLARNVPGISRTLLAARLRALERSSIVVRERETTRNATRYRLTPAGQGLRPVVEALNAWGAQWGIPTDQAEDVDPLIAICMLKSRMRGAALPPARVVIEAVVTGEPETRAWLVCENQQVSMCFDHPGFDVDLTVTGDKATLYHVWLQRLSVADAVRCGRVTVDGPTALARAFPQWFEE